jgi:small subunit ribosomal protein S16
VIEELGYYDPMVKETDARAVLNAERVAHWLSVGAQPSEKVRTLIKKYGANGTHLEAQKAALARLTVRPTAPPPVVIELPKKKTAAEIAAEAAAAEAAAGEGADEGGSGDE